MPNGNPSKHPEALTILANIQRHIYNGTIQSKVGEIAQCTEDKFILEICQRIADNLGVEIDLRLRRIELEKKQSSLKSLQGHLEWATKKLYEVENIKDQCDPKWLTPILNETKKQLVQLSNYYILLDKVPDITDECGEVVELGDLVYIPCQDEKGNNYEHYGVVIGTPKGFDVAHFFTGQTIKSRNSLSEKGFGYVHQVAYQPRWIINQHLRSLENPTLYHEIIERIQKSKATEKKIWSKLDYNCEHWAREMFCGVPECKQKERIAEEIQIRKFGLKELTINYPVKPNQIVELVSEHNETVKFWVKRQITPKKWMCTRVGNEGGQLVKVAYIPQ